MNQNKIDVVTIKKAIKMLGCSRVTFYSKYKPKLEQLPTTDNRVYFKLTDIEALIEKENQKIEHNYNIID